MGEPGIIYTFFFQSLDSIHQVTTKKNNYLYEVTTPNANNRPFGIMPEPDNVQHVGDFSYSKNSLSTVDQLTNVASTISFENPTYKNNVSYDVHIDFNL